jgi:hypothetical protein
MKFRTLVTIVIVLTLIAVADAQIKVSGSVQCGKADQEHLIQIGDSPNHSFSVTQGKCTYTKPFEVSGTQSKESLYTTMGEISGDTSRYRGYFVDVMANGDKAYYRFEGIQTVKDGIPQSGKDTWTLIRGTGKLKGLKGKGTGTLKSSSADGSTTWDVENEFELPK